MIGRVIEEEGQKIVQTLAGATAGTVCKVNYGVDCNYAIPITPNEVGEGYVGVSCVCKGPYYNPATGTLTVCSVCAKSSEAESADKVMSNSLTGDTVYNMAMWCATSDGCYNSIGFSGGRSITYNPYTATLATCCGYFPDELSTNKVCISNSIILGSRVDIDTQTGLLPGLIDTNAKFWWHCEAYFGSTTCICKLNLGATVASNYPSGCFLVRTGTGCVDYDSTLTLVRDEDPSHGYICIGGRLVVSGDACLSSISNPNYYICSNGAACFNTVNATCFCGSATSAAISAIATNLTLCDTTACRIYAEVGYNNEFNVYTTGDYVWFNYRGGTNTVKLADGSGTGGLGTLCAATLCGALCGNASTSTCANYHCRIGYNAAYDFHIALENGNTTTNSQTYVSTACFLRFCGTTGALRILNGSGCPGGSISADRLCAGAGGIETYYDVNGYCDDSNHTQTWYIYCDGSACFDGSVDVCGNLAQQGCDVLTERCLAPLGICKFGISGNTLIICAR